jgi:integrase
MDLKTLIDAFLASYQGRDPSLLTRLAFWRQRLGDKPIAAIDADMVDVEMGYLAERGALKYIRGTGIVPAHRPLSPATLNRHLVALGSVLSYARKRRLLPRGHVSAIQGVDKLRESEGRLLYLTEEQVEKVIACAALARRRKLPALIRMAFTTGLRSGALKALRWRDIELGAGRAVVERT